tara:strand:+ start:367 stop:561 length:195 start_codon:yes stop_codon:yes gene_type:complete
MKKVLLALVVALCMTGSNGQEIPVPTTTIDGHVIILPPKPCVELVWSPTLFDWFRMVEVPCGKN